LDFFLDFLIKEVLTGFSDVCVCEGCR